MTKITQNSILSSFTATTRFILRKCNPKLLNVNNAPVKTVFDSSWETRRKELSATNFNYHPAKRNIAPPSPPPCVIVQLSDIATYNPSTSQWNLTQNQTIHGCLTILSGTTLVLNSPGYPYVLTNNGTIANNGTISIGEAEFYNNGTITNNGTINNLENVGSQFLNNSGGLITNNAGGIINVTGADADLQNYQGGTIANNHNGNITINNGASFQNAGTFYNTGNINLLNSSLTVFNSAQGGYIYNSLTGLITLGNSATQTLENDGIIYTFAGGTIVGTAATTLNNQGTIYTGASACGSGTITGTLNITGTPTTPGCPITPTP